MPTLADVACIGWMGAGDDNMGYIGEAIGNLQHEQRVSKLNAALKAENQQLRNELKYLVEVCDTNLEMKDDLHIAYAKRLLAAPIGDMSRRDPR